MWATHSNDLLSDWSNIKQETSQNSSWSIKGILTWTSSSLIYREYGYVSLADDHQCTTYNEIFPMSVDHYAVDNIAVVNTITFGSTRLGRFADKLFHERTLACIFRSNKTTEKDVPRCLLFAQVDSLILGHCNNCIRWRQTVHLKGETTLTIKSRYLILLSWCCHVTKKGQIFECFF